MKPAGQLVPDASKAAPNTPIEGFDVKMAQIAKDSALFIFFRTAWMRETEGEGGLKFCAPPLQAYWFGHSEFFLQRALPLPEEAGNKEEAAILKNLCKW